MTSSSMGKHAGSGTARMQKLHLFIDTNAFLSFFAYTKDDVERRAAVGGGPKASSLV
jgi:hypothetical protein